MIVKEEVEDLCVKLRTYEEIKSVKVAHTNRLHALNPTRIAECEIIPGLEKLKGGLLRRIQNLLKSWLIYTEWLVNIPGCGPYISGNLILLYYYKFVPCCKHCGTDYTEGDFTCPECGKEAKGNGVINTRIVERDFPNVSKWWSFMGRNIVDGKMPKCQKGVRINWSPLGRKIGYDFADQVNRQQQTEPYKAYLLERREYRLKTHPGASKLHNLNMAKNETVKLFLSHFWHVARTLDGKPTEGPYILTVGGHTGIIPPFYWTG